MWLNSNHSHILNPSVLLFGVLVAESSMEGWDVFLEETYLWACEKKSRLKLGCSDLAGQYINQY